MDSLVIDFHLQKLSKIVLQGIQRLENPNSKQSSKNIGLRFQNLYEHGLITKHDNLLLQSRVLLNEFCSEMEQKIGRGAKCGFLFYSEKQHKLFYGAGRHYPEQLKRFLHKRPPTVDLFKDHHYTNEIFTVPTLDEWHDDWENFAQEFKKTWVKSLISKRLRYKGISFGTFEVCFPEENEPRESDIELIIKEVQPVKEALYVFRNEMETIVSTYPDSLLLIEPEKPALSY